MSSLEKLLLVSDDCREINLKLDESCISNPRSKISDWTVRVSTLQVQFQISDFGFEMQDSSNFKLSYFPSSSFANAGASYTFRRASMIAALCTATARFVSSR